jgi:sarcosine oxidase
MHDAIIIGGGVMGSAVAWQLAHRGLDVRLIEQFEPGHARGSSHGRSRIIRTAYYEHPDYIPLVRRSFELWNELAADRPETPLLHACDCVGIGPPDGELMTGLKTAHTLLPDTTSVLDAAAIRDRWGVQVPDYFQGLLDREAGVLAAEASVLALHAEAQANGAVMNFGETVCGWQSTGDTVRVLTDAAEYSAWNVVITAGPWLMRLVPVPITVMRQVMLWFEPLAVMTPASFPTFLIETPGGAYYGLPAIDSHGVKVALHYGADEVSDVAAIRREVTDADKVTVRSFIDNYLPGKLGECIGQQSCLYTLSPDRHFIIDRHPQHANVIVAGGFSGHGFKFAPVVGEAIAEMIADGQTQHPLDRFRFSRFTTS